MTREEAKKRAELYSALVEGKTIQCINTKGGTWEDVKIEEFLRINDSNNYRIKSEPKYRPFKNQEECLQEMQKHQPFGWVKEKAGEGLYLIYCINNCIDTIYDINSFEEAINIYEFMDGTPFGVKED